MVRDKVREGRGKGAEGLLAFAQCPVYVFLPQSLGRTGEKSSWPRGALFSQAEHQPSSARAKVICSDSPGTIDADYLGSAYTLGLCFLRK